MSGKTRTVFYTLCSAAAALVFYIFLHELGHTIVMLSAGATVTEFSILTAHVSAAGGNYTDLSDLWLHANGALLPVFVSLVYGLLYRKDCGSSFYRIFSFLALLTPTGSMLAWGIIPFLYLRGIAPAGDDVTNFLFNFSQSHHPLMVSVFAAVIIGVSVGVMVKKQIIQNYLDEIKGK